MPIFRSSKFAVVVCMAGWDPSNVGGQQQGTFMPPQQFDHRPTGTSYRKRTLFWGAMSQAPMTLPRQSAQDAAKAALQAAAVSFPPLSSDAPKSGC
jgi:hypothetical protein